MRSAPVVLVAVPLLVLLDSLVALMRGWDPGEEGSRLDGIVIAVAAIVVIASILARRFVARRSGQFLLLAVSGWGAWSVAELALVWAGIPPEREGAFHLNEPNDVRTFHPRPELHLDLDPEVRHTTNSLGMRGPELPPRSEAYRLLCVGGSSTECALLGDDQTWPVRLSEELNRRSDPRRVWVGNAGKAAFTTQEHLVFVRESPLVREMDALIFLVGFNDRMRFLRTGKLESELERYRSVKPLWHRSRMVRTLRVIWHSGRPRLVRVQTLHPEFTPRELPDLGPALREYSERIRVLFAEGRSRGQRVIFCTQPVLWDAALSAEGRALLEAGSSMDGPYYTIEMLRKAADRYNETLLRTCAEIGAECVDLSSMNGRLEYFYDDCHYTRTGAREVARRIAEAWSKESENP